MPSARNSATKLDEGLPTVDGRSRGGAPPEGGVEAAPRGGRPSALPCVLPFRVVECTHTNLQIPIQAVESEAVFWQMARSRPCYETEPGERGIGARFGGDCKPCTNPQKRRHSMHSFQTFGPPALVDEGVDSIGWAKNPLPVVERRGDQGGFRLIRRSRRNDMADLLDNVYRRVMEGEH